MKNKIEKIINDHFIIICISLIILYISYNSVTADCMTNEYYFNGYEYCNYKNMIAAKKMHFFKVLAQEDVLGRTASQIKQLFYKDFDFGQRVNFNLLLNQNNTPQEIAAFAKKYIQFLY